MITDYCCDNEDYNNQFLSNGSKNNMNLLSEIKTEMQFEDIGLTLKTINSDDFKEFKNGQK